MYLRFIKQFINEYNEPETEVFQALRFVRDHPSTQDEDIHTLKDLRDWFNANLEAPNPF